ncbi:SDR family NAD(P)-dependent oxidoreductase [Aliiroseovarius sp. YM-037]|uniref:SDR family NAD(P)-dependent oxidoreductase n=1 Tax=Aliiroseovarius sp. YM-037 TaxID=3341728 RepID=UPI003A7F77FF
MKRALIIGASGGIGQALGSALRNQGAEVVGLSRSQDGLDIRDEASIAAALEPLSGQFDLILNVTGALEIDGMGPEKAIRDVDADRLHAQFETNALGPMLVLKHALRLMPRDRRTVFAALSARVGSIGDNRLGGWYSYRAAKAALNQLIHTAAIEVARTHKQAICAVLHPGTVQTALTKKYVGDNPAVPPEESAANLLAVIDDLDISQSGGFFDWRGDPVVW